jgi:hypothetical protein
VEARGIGLIRIAGSLPALRWAFVGGLIAVFVDLSDLFWRGFIDLGGLPNYQSWDKWLDQVYMLFFLWVSLRWRGPARRIAIVLFGWRMIGFVAFEASGVRELLLAFPNVFEFWFLFVASLPHWRPHFAFARGPTLAWGAVLLSLKEFQEYALHWGKWLDSFTFTEAIDAIWNTVTFPFG